MNIVEIRQPLKEKYGDELTNVYINNYDDQRILREWCIENFGDYRLSYARKELDEPFGTTVFMFVNMEEAIAFKLRWI